MEGANGQLQTKYQKIATEYSKIRAQANVLKKAVIEEQARNADIRNQLKEKEVVFRRAEQEIDSLTFRNQQLTKRITVLQEELDKAQNRPKKGKGKASENNSQIPSLPPPPNNILDEEFQKKIVENAQLLSQISDKDSEIESLYERIQQLECKVDYCEKSKVESECQYQGAVDKLERERNDLQRKLNDRQKQEETVSWSSNEEKEINHWKAQYHILKIKYDELEQREPTTTSQIDGDTLEPIEVNNMIGKLSAPFAIPEEIEARELKIRDYFLEEIERLTNEKHVYHIKNLAMAANSEVMHVQLDTSESKREKCEAALLETLSNYNGIQKEKEAQEVNYKVQLNTMSEHLANMNEKLIFQTEAIQQLRFELANKVKMHRFADKQMRLVRLKAARAQLEEKCMKALERHKQRDKLICDINTCKERVRLLQSLVNETKQSIFRGQQRLDVLKDVNHQLGFRVPRHEDRIEKLHRYVNGLKVKQEKQKEAVDRKREQLKKVIRTAAKQLIQYIFPLSKVQPNRSLCNSEDSDSATSDILTSALADASVEPTLPATGDYSAYSLWVAANKDGVPGTNKENAMHNPAYNISAALTYATQLVNVLAYYINVRLPYKITCGEFCGNELSDQKFARKVARLNSNVLHLCLTQNTKIEVLHPMHTLQNLMHLLNTEISDLGRIGPMEVDPSVIAQLHNQLVPDLENSDDSASDEEDLCWGWEAVSHTSVPSIACPEMAVPTSGAMISQQSSSMQVHQSVAGGLVTSAAASIASIWRGWTNK
ncbi:Beclin 1-associated autophagy-related key regulator [Temnothorax longispinosus]|uniref:Beclin 1-associated autophagy-related key regulator n=1 Tax=Temnothorax longispinosus TaxID=300112 RepID=A0A4S2L951_9HYME|nr:Beclin 1-associated autophagy-related key regulator [Temnothorax longispinosus]